LEFESKVLSKEQVMGEKFDVIVVGSGIAGLSAALAAAKAKSKSVCLIERGSERNSNSYFAQGGIACALSNEDSWKNHALDTMNAGAGLCNRDAVNFITKSGPAAVRELMDLGLGFDGGNERPGMGLEGGHGKSRVLHIKGDQTGREMTLFLKKIAKEQKDIHFLESTMLREILAQKKKYSGIEFLGNDEPMFSRSLVLATGGYAACFEKTTNPATTLGSGISIAQKAGCEISGMEFIQFHPTTLHTLLGGNFLVSEAVRGEGGKVVNGRGKTIVDPLDTRDKVSIAIYRELEGGGKVFLDTRGFDSGFFRERFPTVYSELIENRINPEKDLIPIETAAHYTIGGVKTDLEALTSIKGIYAAGECANCGLHGANRLASNSLLEGLVMGKIAGKNAANYKGQKIMKTDSSMKMDSSQENAAWREGIETEAGLAAMKKTMWKSCGVIRQEKLLTQGLAAITGLEKKTEINDSAGSLALQNAFSVCKMTIEAALARKESMGTHYRLN